MRRCPNCLRPVNSGDTICSFCDEQLPNQKMKGNDSDPRRNPGNRPRDERSRTSPADEGAASPRGSTQQQPQRGQTPPSQDAHGQEQPPPQQSLGSQTPPRQDNRYCSNCSATLSTGTDICPSCGAAAKPSQRGQQQENTRIQEGRRQVNQQRSRKQHPTEQSGIGRRSLLTGIGVALIATVGGGYYLIQNGSVRSGGGPPVDSVDLSLADVRRPDFGVTSATLSLVFEIANTNQSSAIPSPTIDYKVFINEVEVLSTRETLATLEPGSSRREIFEIIINYSDFSTSLINALRSGQASLGVRGSIESEGNSTDFSLTYQF